jgi:hypothetical protein
LMPHFSPISPQWTMKFCWMGVSAVMDFLLIVSVISEYTEILWICQVWKL